MTAMGASYPSGRRSGTSPASWTAWRSHMISDAELLALERNFWTGDAPFYAQHLSDDATMVFPAPTGVLRREQIVAKVAQTPRWRAVRFHDPIIARPSASVAVLTYQAEAMRDDQPPYTSQVTSAYTLAVGGW